MKIIFNQSNNFHYLLKLKKTFVNIIKPNTSTMINETSSQNSLLDRSSFLSSSSSNRKTKYDYKRLYFANKARDILSKGVVFISDNVKITFGPLGRSFLISNYENLPIITKDGVTVARYIKPESRKESLGIRLLSSISGNTNIFSGDGTTTSCVLAGQLIKRGMFLVKNGYDPVSIKDGILFAKKEILKIMKEQRIYANSEGILYNLACICTNNDTYISNLVSKAVFKMGVDGDILIEDSPYDFSFLIETLCYTLPFGMTSKITSIKEKNDEETLKNPLILVMNMSLSNVDMLIGITSFLKEVMKDMVIFCKSISDECSSYLSIYNSNINIKQSGRVFIIHIPDYFDDDYNKELYKDLSIAVGSLLFEEQNSFTVSLEKLVLNEEVYGSCETMTMSNYETLIVKPSGEMGEIEKRINELKEYLKKNEKEMTESHIELYNKRISRLSQRSCVLMIGGTSEVEKHNIRDKIVDCINSLKSAIEKGVVIGGGNIYMYSIYKFNEKYKKSMELEEDNQNKSSFNKGKDIFLESLLDLVRILYSNNTLYSNERIIEEYFKTIDNKSNFYGFNLKSNAFSDNLIIDGVIDSYNTLENAIHDATVLSTLIINTECIIINEYDYNPPPLEVYRHKFRDDVGLQMKSKEEYERVIKDSEEKEPDLENVISNMIQ